MNVGVGVRPRALSSTFTTPGGERTRDRERRCVTHTIIHNAPTPPLPPPVAAVVSTETATETIRWPPTRSSQQQQQQKQQHAISSSPSKSVDDATSVSRGTLRDFPACRPESPLAHARRGAGPNVPPARIETSPTSYVLSIVLPRPGGTPLAPEMITVSARRGGRLAVVADAWHLEHDCHYEWNVAFPPSGVDLRTVRARFGEDGLLVIDVPRRA
ncbi:hypothetical protein B0F90DRAFT_1624016 [Multifurca ochricompacta]|uniref:SHSP domain-containing protein n=1 Tax=Multifurca ochricompacta TaxID=376703 RepID=A0AAD4M9T5_9AGAM|nr:hypothetical protein B0F90DRAFT_1624016 [Multifurca ochricompacta]